MPGRYDFAVYFLLYFKHSKMLTMLCLALLSISHWHCGTIYKELYERKINVIGKLNFLFENINAEGLIQILSHCVIFILL